MENLIAVAVLAVILGLAGGYVYKSRKRGVRCIGCPDAVACAANKGGSSACGGCTGNCTSCGGCRH